MDRESHVAGIRRFSLKAEKPRDSPLVLSRLIVGIGHKFLGRPIDWLAGLLTGTILRFEILIGHGAAFSFIVSGDDRDTNPQRFEGRFMPKINGLHKKPPASESVASKDKLLVSQDVAAQLLSISKRSVEYLVANRRLSTRRIGTRALIPIEDVRRFARTDHPERMAS